MSIQKFVIPEIIFGVDCIDQAGGSLRRLGARRVLLVTTPRDFDTEHMEELFRAVLVCEVCECEPSDHLAPHPVHSLRELPPTPLPAQR